MNRIPFLIIALTSFLLTACIASGQTKNPLEGVWKIIVWVEGGKTNMDPQPALFIFTKSYYSIAMVMAPRTDSANPNAPRPLSDAEKLARFDEWKWFVGISGSYEVKDSMIVMNPIVAKNTWDMKRQVPQKPKFILEGPNSFWLIPSDSNATNVGLRMKLTRLE
ncbi:MAG TPA: hypothetical protein VFU29_13905 [Chitinophagaceae bacterium]|nr:hypothetical protein [Chitinophagaceae bacterium]